MTPCLRQTRGLGSPHTFVGTTVQFLTVASLGPRRRGFPGTAMFKYRRLCGPKQFILLNSGAQSLKSRCLRVHAPSGGSRSPSVCG